MSNQATQPAAEHSARTGPLAITPAEWQQMVRIAERLEETRRELIEDILDKAERHRKCGRKAEYAVLRQIIDRVENDSLHASDLRPNNEWTGGDTSALREPLCVPAPRNYWRKENADSQGN